MYRSMALFFTGLFLGVIAIESAQADGGRLGLDAKQMIVCLAANSSSFEGTLQLVATGWRAVAGFVWPGRPGLGART
jgi:hypothetical protein